MLQSIPEISSDAKEFQDDNREYFDDLSTKQKICPNCTQRLDLHTNGSSVCKSPWYVALHYDYIYR